MSGGLRHLLCRFRAGAGWLAGWLLCFVFHFCLAVLFSLFLSNVFFLFFYSAFHLSVFFFSAYVFGVLACIFFVRVLISVGMAKSPCCTAVFDLCISVS